jgi:hypothetical protein
VLVGFVEFGGLDALFVQREAQQLKRLSVTSRQVDQRRVVVVRATELKCIFESGMAGLNSLVREGEISAGDGVEIGLAGNLQHDNLVVG